MFTKNDRFNQTFGLMEDHRVERTRLHSMENILFISLAAVLSGCETWNEIEDFGHNKIEWLSRHLDLPNGIPAHDTFNRFFSGMNPIQFEQCFRRWVEPIVREISGDVISIDGKRILGASKYKKNPIHIISAWSHTYSISLGQIKTEAKSNEITAIPELLESLMIEGAIITVDALNTQVAIAAKIIEKKAHYLMPIKKNRKNTFRDMEFVFRNFESDSEFTSEEDHHGRLETRNVRVMKDYSGIRKIEIWPDLKSIVKLETIRVIKVTGEIQSSVAYYITSLNLPAQDIAKYIRSHWGIENSLHWMLDVAFHEDAGRKLNQNAVMNFSVLNKMALSVISKEKTVKLGVKSKRLKSYGNDDYRMQLLSMF